MIKHISGLVLAGLVLTSSPVGANSALAPVLGPSAAPEGISLTQMAAITASFNVSDHLDCALLKQPTPGIQMLYLYGGASTSNFDVSEGTYLYLPVAFADDSPPITGDFPRFSIQTPPYVFDLMEIHGTFLVVVDGVPYRNLSNILTGAGYAVGPVSGPLPDKGNNYIVVAEFLRPLPVGTHHITVTVYQDGDALFTGLPPAGVQFGSFGYTVKVAPGTPASFAQPCH